MNYESNVRDSSRSCSSLKRFTPTAHPLSGDADQSGSRDTASADALSLTETDALKTLDGGWREELPLPPAMRLSDLYQCERHSPD